MRKINFLIFINALSMLLLSGQAQAGIYKCVNLQGKTFYHDKPCSVKDLETEMRAIKDPENGYVTPTFVDQNTVENSNQNNTDTGVVEGAVSKKKEKSSSAVEASQTSGAGGEAKQGNTDTLSKSTVGNDLTSGSKDNGDASSYSPAVTAVQGSLSESAINADIQRNPLKYTTH